MTATFAFLGLLHKGPSYGYDLKKAYDGVFGREKPLAFGQVYATLSRLLRDEKIAAEAAEQQAGPERKRYAITNLGRKDLQAWLGKPETAPHNAQAALFVKVATAILVDESPEEFLDVQRAAHLQKMRELTALRRTSDLAQTLRADYALFHLEADLRWIDVTAARINELKRRSNRDKKPTCFTRSRPAQSFRADAGTARGESDDSKRRNPGDHGPSGSGKSTLLHCLAGILVPDKGDVWLADTKLNDLGEEARTKLRREQFGFVFQFGQLVPELTVLENVALSLLLAGKKRDESTTYALDPLDPPPPLGGCFCIGRNVLCKTKRVGIKRMGPNAPKISIASFW